jgi:hypothetical protein
MCGAKLSIGSAGYYWKCGVPTFQDDNQNTWEWECVTCDFTFGLLGITYLQKNQPTCRPKSIMCGDYLGLGMGMCGANLSFGLLGHVTHQCTCVQINKTIWRHESMMCGTFLGLKQSENMWFCLCEVMTKKHVAKENVWDQVYSGKKWILSAGMEWECVVPTGTSICRPCKTHRYTCTGKQAYLQSKLWIRPEYFMSTGCVLQLWSTGHVTYVQVNLAFCRPKSMIVCHLRLKAIRKHVSGQNT